MGRLGHARAWRTADPGRAPAGGGDHRRGLALASAAVAAASATPGGIGTLETTLTAGLIAIGIQPSIAVPVVVAYRLATYWLPVAPGWAALQLLQRRDLI